MLLMSMQAVIAIPDDNKARLYKIATYMLQRETIWIDANTVKKSTTVKTILQGIDDSLHVDWVCYCAVCWKLLHVECF